MRNYSAALARKLPIFWVKLCNDYACFRKTYFGAKFVSAENSNYISSINYYLILILN